MENLNCLNDSLSEADLRFCQFLVDRDNSLSESGCVSDLETSEDEDDAVLGEVAVNADGGIPACAAVPCCACCPLIKDNPVAAWLWGWRNYSTDL